MTLFNQHQMSLGQQQAARSAFGMGSLSEYFYILPASQDPRNVSNPIFALQFPNALYNWEVFYHLPMMAASSLSKQHRYSEARRWFHFIFDPSTDDPIQGRERFWHFLPFRHTNQSATIVQLLNTLANPQARVNDKKRVQDKIDHW